MKDVDNEILQALSARKSVRVYTEEPVTDAERDAILQAAFCAAMQVSASASSRSPAPGVRASAIPAAW